jgi:hypothetical protein
MYKTTNYNTIGLGANNTPTLETHPTSNQMGKVNTEINQLGKPNFFPNQT